MRSLPLSCSAADRGRHARAELVAERAGGRTILRRQHVGYPFHITRGFHLDTGRPDLLTLYIQSASGGLYANDRIGFDIGVGQGAALHVTTQAATVVHNGEQGGSLLQQRLDLADDALCAVTSDPYVLFPGADLRLETTAVVSERSVLLLAEGFAVHDPRATSRGFLHMASLVRIMRPDGAPVMQDYGSIAGEHWESGALGPWAATGTMILVAPPDRCPAPAAVTAAIDASGCMSGASRAPANSGLIVRLLAADGGTLARGLDAAFHVAAFSAIGVELSRRRK